MKLYTQGERYVTLATLVRIMLECFVILTLTGLAFDAARHGHVVAAGLMILGVSMAMAVTIISAAMAVRR